MSGIQLKKRSSWQRVIHGPAKLADAFEHLPYTSAQIIVSDAKLQIGPSIPTLGDYLEKFHAGRCTVMGLYIEDDSSTNKDIDKQISYSNIVSIFVVATMHACSIPFTLLYTLTGNTPTPE